jgi:heme-degrading monooxygenase HmoA
VKVVLFRNHPKEGAYGDEYRSLQRQLVKTVSSLPGFVSVDEFRGPGGETLVLAKFASDEALASWREHPEHRAAQRRRGEFYADYTVEVCSLDRDYGWQADGG